MKQLIGKFNTEEEKRFRFDGIIKIECPSCKAEMKKDFNRDHLYYQKQGSESEMYFCCQNCDSEYLMPFTLKSVDVVLEYDETRLKKED